MDRDQIVNKMNTYLKISTNLLVEWLGKILPKVSNNWWEECVLDKLSDSQREIALKRGFSSLKDFDLIDLLRIADKSWYSMVNVTSISTRERKCVSDMIGVRNNWAYTSELLPGKDVIIRDLETLKKFLLYLNCEDDIVNEVDSILDEIKSTSIIDTSLHLKGYQGSFVNDNEDNMIDENKITEKSLVYLVGNPDVRGIVMSITQLDSTRKYDVFVDGNFKTFYSGQIALYEEKKTYNWKDINTFRSYLTAYLINNPSGNDLYSLNSARIDFVPYQFRPALKIIHADEPRILIADSVGVGKTIEAGLIIKELQARNELEKILIICPKPLVTERKWEMEMGRFDEEFIPVDGPLLRQIISDTDRDGEWPMRFSRAIIPYSILDSRAYEGEITNKKHSYGLKNLDPSPHFDLVIIDEAHHIRNGSMDKDKAFEYKCVKYFCDNSDAVVMLTATPLQTSNDDLFTLLNVLRPDVVIDKQTFNMMARPNAHISAAVSIMRRTGENWQGLAIKEMKKILDTQWGENVISTNPIYSNAIKKMEQADVTREERVKLISDVESLHSFNSMLSRTRRKDIQDFCIRRSYTLAVDFTDSQKELYKELLHFESTALLQLHGNSRAIPFMMSTIKRQAASCIFGLAPHIRDIVNKRFRQIEDDFGDSSVSVIDEKDITILEGMAQRLLVMADNLPDEDPKFDQMLKTIKEKQKQDNNKIILFSTFRYTLYYLKKKLIDAGLRAEQVDGSTSDPMRQELRSRFELSKEKPAAIDILLFTEVGSEGLDYQFCDMMINYDLPWNPMRIEQRIGRIDRRGQRSESVGIYNMITNGTVDADIYYRCLMRIGIFESSIGECDEILGDIATQLDQIGMDALLTDEERKEKIEQMADNEVRRLQELNKLEEEEKEFFGLDLSEYVTAQEIQNAENPWLIQSNLQLLVEQYLNRRLGEGKYILGDGVIKQIRLSEAARAKIREDYKKLPNVRNAVRRSWDGYLKGKMPIHPLTFDPETAEKERESFFITAMHPLVKQSAAYFASDDKAYIRIKYFSNNYNSGSYYFSVYAWSYVGMNPRFKLVVVCDDDVLAKDLPDILQEAQNGVDTYKIQPRDWDDLEKKQVKFWMDAKAREIKEAENIALFKIESLTNNFKSRKRSLEQKILDSKSQNICKMYTGQLEKATGKYELKVEEIRKKVLQTDIHTTLIANGILDVVN